MKVLAIDVGGTAIKSALVDENGDISGFREMATPSVIIDGIVKAAKGYNDYSAVGISTAGIVDHKKGTVVFSSAALGYIEGEPLALEVTESLGVPVTVENDVNCAALGEARFGAGRGLGDFVCLTYGTAVGGALYLNGGLYRGYGNMAGEVGHIATHAFGKKCACGGRGCYSEYASASALVAKAMEVDEKYCDGRAIAAGLSDGRLMEAVLSWADEVCVGLAAVIHMFDPPRVILGGGIMNDKIFVDIIRERLKGHIMPAYAEAEVMGAEMGNRAGLLGAAALALEEAEKP
ncbi:MAG: ROK family protein [Clostridiaceae bacterium]|nr:ROK family protein [Clostridiaceae bacterium]